MNKPTITAVLSGLTLVGLADPALALQLSAGVGARVEYNNNIERVDDDERSDVERAALLDLGLVHKEGSVDADMQYHARYLDYLHDVESDKTEVEGRTNLLWELFPRTFRLVLNHQLTEEVASSRLADTSDNRERRSVLTGGFDWILHLGSVDSVTVSPRHVEVDFQGGDVQGQTGTDSERNSAAVIWDHRLDPTSGLQLRTEYADAKFVDSINDYDSYNAMLSYYAAVSRLTYEFGAGFNKIEKDEGDSSFDGYTVRASADYKADALLWGGSLVRELTDSSIGLSGAELELPNFQAQDTNYGQFDIIERTKAELHATKPLGQTAELSGSIFYSKDEYQDLDKNEKKAGAELRYAYTFNSAWSASVSARYTKVDSDDPLGNATYRDLDTLASLIYQMTRHVDLSLDVGNRHRTTDNEAAVVGYSSSYAGIQIMARY